MDCRIVWSRTALADLHDLVHYIAADDTVAASRFGERLIAKVDSLAPFPEMGRIVPEFGDELIREVVLTPYRIIYEVDKGEGSLSILRIWHGARVEPSLQK